MIIIEGQLFFNPDLDQGTIETDGTSYPSDNVGDVVNAQTHIRFQDYVLATTDDRDSPLISLIFRPDADLTDGILPDPRHLWTSKIGGFENIKVGDQVTTVSNKNGSPHVRTVKRVVNGQLLLMSLTYGVANEVVLNLGAVSYVSTPIESIEFFHNLIENNQAPNFADLTTGVIRRARVEGLLNTDTVTIHPMEQLGDKSYQYGSLSVVGNGIGDGTTPPNVSQAFIIKQTYLVAPLFLAEQINDDLSGIAPPYLLDQNSLKYIARIEASKDLINPNDVKTIVSSETLGATGWELDNLNTGLTNYSISDVVYKRSGGEVIDALELSTNEMTVEFDINNTINSPFSIGNTKLVFNHEFMPLPEEEYRLPEFPTGVNAARSRVLKENFLFDRAPCILGTPNTTPDNLGGVDQIIKQVDPTHISNSKIHVVVTIEMSNDAVERISSLTDQNYKLFVSICDHNKTRAKSDKVNLPVDKSTYFTETSDPTMITITNSFHNHPMIQSDTGKESLLIRPQDDFVCTASFVLDRNDVPNFPRADAEIDFLSVTAQLVARKDASNSFVLDQYRTSFNGLQIINDPVYGTVPEIDITEDRGFASPVDDFRRNVRIRRRYDLDTPATGLFNYEITFPEIQRFAPWESLPAASNEFLDPAAPDNEHKGKNHDWPHYFDGTGWNMYFEATIVATKDGIPQTYTSSTLLTTEDYDQGNEWDTEALTSFRTDGSGDPITGFGFMTSENTLIKGDMTYIGLDANPALPDLVMQLFVNVFEGTNYKGMFAISSKYDIATDNAFIGLLGILRATKTNPSGDIFRVEAELNHLNFTADTTIGVTSRFHDTRGEAPPQPPAIGILEEDGTFILEEGVAIIFGIEEE